MVDIFEIQTFCGKITFPLSSVLAFQSWEKKEKSGNGNIAPAAEKENRKTWRFRAKHPSLRTTLSFCFRSGFPDFDLFFWEKTRKPGGKAARYSIRTALFIPVTIFLFSLSHGIWPHNLYLPRGWRIRKDTGCVLLMWLGKMNGLTKRQQRRQHYQRSLLLGVHSLQDASTVPHREQRCTMYRNVMTVCIHYWCTNDTYIQVQGGTW